MKIDAMILRETLERALTCDDFAERFYSRLRAVSPMPPRGSESVAPRNSPGVERKLFSQELCSLVDAIDDPKQIAREARNLVWSRDEYGIEPAMYTAIEAALIGTLREASGDEWSEHAERSWMAAYEGVADAIRRARAGY